MSLYTTGTITGALNATTITGTGTKWSDAKIGITNGSVLFVSSNAGVDGVYQVKRVISDTSIELVQPIYKLSLIPNIRSWWQSPPVQRHGLINWRQRLDTIKRKWTAGSRL